MDPYLAEIRRLLDEGEFQRALAAADAAPAPLKAQSKYYELRAIALARTGNVEQAEAAYRDAIERDPENINARADLCRIYAYQDRADEAQAELAALQSRCADNPLADVIIGEIKLQLGRSAEAREALERAYAAGERSPLLLMALAQARYASELFDSALDAARQARRLHGDSINLLYVMGPAAIAANDAEETKAALSKLDRLPPNIGDPIRRHWAERLRAQALHAEAADLLEPAAERLAGDFYALLELIQSMTFAGRIHALEPWLERALKDWPDEPMAQARVAMALIVKGDMETARKAAERALERDPHLIAAHNVLIEIDAKSHADRLIETFADEFGENFDKSDAAADDGQLENRSEIAFALGRCYESKGDLDNAFRAFDHAHALLRRQSDIKGWGYQRDSLTRVQEWLGREFTADVIIRRRKPGYDGARHVFVVGMPRSGSTLIEQIISSHPEAWGVGENMAFRQVFAEYQKLRFNGEASDDELPFDRWIEYYAKSLPEDASGAMRVVDKMLSNYRHLGLISSLFPNAKVIHAKRHPLDICLSIYRRSFSSRNRFAIDENTIAHYYRLYEQTMEMWREQLPHEIFEVEYESFVEDPEPRMRAMIDYCGLEWSDACLSFYANERAVITHSVAQVRKDVTNEAKGRWRKYGERISPLIEALRREGVALPDLE